MSKLELSVKRKSIIEFVLKFLLVTSLLYIDALCLAYYNHYLNIVIYCAGLAASLASAFLLLVLSEIILPIVMTSLSLAVRKHIKL